MEVRKITTGFVTQRFDEKGKFLGQDFTCGDECDYEDENGEILDLDEIVEPDYEPYKMVQANEVVIDRELLKSLLDQIVVGDLKSGAALDKIRANM